MSDVIFQSADLTVTADPMTISDALDVGNDLCAYAGGAFPPGQWATSPANAWTQYVHVALVGRGYGYIARINGGRGIAYALAKPHQPGQHLLLALDGHNGYGELAQLRALLQRQAHAAGAVLGTLQQTFVPLQ